MQASAVLLSLTYLLFYLLAFLHYFTSNTYLLNNETKLIQIGSQGQQIFISKFLLSPTRPLTEMIEFLLTPDSSDAILKFL